MKKAIVLLSGGLDSTTVLYLAKSRGYEVHALIFHYGQRHSREVTQARAIARRAGCPAHVVRFSLPWKGSSLLDPAARLPLNRRAMKGIPSTYVPARNTIFLSFALSWAEAIRADSIFIGANALDYSGYPDCRPAYFSVFQRLGRLATKRGVEGAAVRIEVPLLRMKKSQIIKAGVKLGAPYELSWSCYQGGKSPCGRCDSCLLRAKGFREAGIRDPLMEKKSG
ncbi:MAG: 7-cyano-7-deazaguanine synthase QueC [Candidatus Omnitrophota bacterium]